MTIVAGIDVGSTYTKAVLLDEHGTVHARAMQRTGFKLPEVSQAVFERCLEQAGLGRERVDYVVATGYGRHQVPFRDIHATELTAAARGATTQFPGTRTLLDVGGQTMKASRIEPDGKVKSFRLNDKCAAGTGAFLEKTARYLGYGTEEIGPLAATSKEPVSISGVCAVFAESEVINHVSSGACAADILHGAMASLVDRSVQLLKRARVEPEVVLVGGILRFETMVRLLSEKLGVAVQVPAGDMVQLNGALGAAVLARKRLLRLQETGAAIRDEPRQAEVPA
jgi:(R)-2-hydroxyacyl-CoA dehydratese activating ATPase